MSPPVTALLERLFERAGVELHLDRLDGAALLAGLPPGVPAAAVARLAMAERAAELAPRSLYLDADTLATAPLAPLLAAPLDGDPFGAVRDAAIPDVTHKNGVRGWQRLGLDPSLPVFNSGVLLIDNARWLEARVGEAALAELRDHPQDLAAWEQGALNAAGAGDWTALDARWNTQVRNELALRLPGGRGLAKGGLRTPAPPGILHFTGRIKPWQPAYPPNPARAAYLAAWRRLLGGEPEAPLPALPGPMAWAAARAAGRMPERSG